MLVQSMNNDLRARLGRTPGLIRVNGSRLMVGGAHFGVYMPFAVLEPNQPSTERTMLKLVKQLNRDDALLMCGFLNCVTSGSGPTELLSASVAPIPPSIPRVMRRRSTHGLPNTRRQIVSLCFFKANCLNSCDGWLATLARSQG